jgi:metal-sulfur cluster biosynthetic enzyme
MPPSERTQAVWRAIARVADPELDQSIVDLGFVTDVAVDGGRVAISFRLPTFWCSANFAWIMAEDMRSALARLGWVSEAEIRLVDHFAADKINAGIAAGGGFRQAFGAEAADDLAGLRQTFQRKAFLGRMSAVVEALRRAGWSDARLAALCIADLAALSNEPALRPAAERYLELRAVYGGACGPMEPAFRTAEGGDIPAGRLPDYLREIRMTRRSVEANGEMCRILLKQRYAAPVPA